MQHHLFDKKPPATYKELRDYQRAAVEAIFDYFNEFDGAPLIVIPTGGGKSLVIAEFNREANMHFPGTKTMVLTHSSILLSQNAEELLNQWPDADISFYADKLGSKDLSGQIIFASIQSIYKRAYDLRHAPDLILVDEAHAIDPEEGTMYEKFFADMRIINPYIKIVGFTATPFRTGYGYLHKGKKALFTHIAYEISILDLIQRGHLCPVVTPDGGMKTRMDTAGIKHAAGQFGDFINKQLKKLDDPGITKACVDEIILYGAERNKWIVFTIDIEHCTHVLEEIGSRGIDAEMVHSKMDERDVSRAIDRFKNGTAKCLVNVAMLTTGANFPAIDMMAFMRPTRSPVLYIQMAGRGMRLFPGKHDCLLLDFGGVVEELGPIDQVRVYEKGDGTGAPPMKLCPQCNSMCMAGHRICPNCGYEFPESEIHLDTTASTAAALSPQLKPQRIKVTRVMYYRHKKEGKPDMLRIEYLCGFDTYRDWMFFEHQYTAREKSCAWWRMHAATVPPNTITEALARKDELAVPKYIYVKKVGKHQEVVGVDFTEGEDDGEA